MKKHRKAMLRITVAATSLMLAVTAFISLSSNASHSMRHSIVLGHSEIQQALGLSSTPQYYEYMHQEPKPLSLGYSQDGGFPLGYSQNSGLSLGYSQDGDLLVDNSGNHSTDQTYLLTREIYEIADQIHIPHDSAILKSQVLEALEEKILVRFYGGGEDDTICKTCQTIVAMDIKTQELTIVVINADGNQHVVEVSVDGYQMNPLDGDNLETQQWEANMEYSLTDEEIIQYAADDGTYVELIHSGQVDVGNWAPPGITKPDSKPDHELGPESGPNLQSNEYDGVIFDPIPNIEVNNWSRIDTDPEKNQDTHALHTAIILHKHTETLEQTGNTAKLAVPGSGMILSSIPIMPAALLLEQDPDNFYLIRTPEELDAIRNNDLTANYRLDNNIDLTGYVSPTCTLTNGWVGIGRTESQPFRGEFDGNGYTITGLWRMTSI